MKLNLNVNHSSLYISNIFNADQQGAVEPHPPLLAEPKSYRIKGNFRPGNATPIYISIANVSHLTLTKESLPEIFRLANQYTLNSPYPLGDWPMRYRELAAYRPNHNGTHSARKTAHLDAILDLVRTRGSKAAKDVYASLSEDEILNLQLAAYFLRAGRVDESDHIDPPVDDYNTRSALIYEEYANQLGVNSSTIRWIKKLITNSCKPRGDRDSDIDTIPKNKFGFEALSLAHELDLVRCFDPEKMKHSISKIRNRLNYFIPDPQKGPIIQKMIQYAKDLCEVTGCHREYDNAPGNRKLFVECSAKGDFCWQRVKSIPIPKWS